MEKELVFDINKELEVHCASVLSRPKVLGMAFGLSFAMQAELPPIRLEENSLDSIYNYFNNNLRAEFNQCASRLNEKVVFATDVALKFALEVYQIRYRALYPVSTDPNLIVYGFFDTLVGVERIVSPQTHEFANEHKKAIYVLSNKLTRWMQEKQWSYLARSHP